MNRKLTGVLLALGLALAGTVLLVGYVHSAEARALEGDKLVNVLVVKDKIESGTKAEDIADHVTTEQVPQKVRADGAVSDLADLAGKVANVDLLKGEQVVADRFVSPQEAERGDVPDGLLEVTVSLEPARALGGRLAPGDTVGVIASFQKNEDGPDQTHLILHKVQVTGVQAEQEAPKPDNADATPLAPTGKLLVTLAVDAPSAERIVFAAEHGTLWLSAEPKDANEGGTRVWTRGAVFG